MNAPSTITLSGTMPTTMMISSGAMPNGGNMQTIPQSGTTMLQSGTTILPTGTTPIPRSRHSSRSSNGCSTCSSTLSSE